MIYGMIYNETPSHGYLEVHLSLVERVGFKPSPWSLHGHGRALLEEDSDMPAFLKMMDEQGIEYHIYTVQTDADFDELLNTFYNFDL